jgi:uncharacterized protein (DUF427 family)
MRSLLRGLGPLGTGEEYGMADVDGSGMPVESVWDYPRPPRLEPVGQRLRVIHAGVVVADTLRGMRILETSHPPVYYFPAGDVAMEFLSPSAQRGSFCEFKGVASYWDLSLAGSEVPGVAWSYATPSKAYAALAGCLAFYASKVDECWVGDERVAAQAGDFYGGWITANLRGPFKGAPGTRGW